MLRTLFLPWTFAALVLLTPAMPPLAAQQSGTLSLQKALEMAKQRNLDLLSARTRRGLLSTLIRPLRPVEILYILRCLTPLFFRRA